MAWVNPSTRAAGTVITAAIWNQDLVANTEYLAKPPSVSVTRTTEQLIPTASWRALAFTAEQWDTDTMWSSTAATKIDINTNGKYLVTMTVGFAQSTAGGRQCGILTDGTTSAAPNQGVVSSPGFAAQGSAMSITRLLSLTSTQFVRAAVYQTSGGNLNVAHDAENIPSCAVLWVSS